MATPHTWTPEEEFAWRTWELPETLKADAFHNHKEIEAFIRDRGYLVEHGLLNLLVERSSDLRPRLRFSQTPSHSLGDALVSALQGRPEPAPEPQPFQGDTTHKLVEARAGDVTNQPLNVSDKTALREDAKEDWQQVLEEVRKAKSNLEQMHAKTECEAMSVNNCSGTAIDHNFVNLLRQIFAKNADGSVNWVRTREERQKYLTEHQWRLEHGLPTSPSIPLNRF
jgi:hypothetical protein